MRWLSAHTPDQLKGSMHLLKVALPTLTQLSAFDTHELAMDLLRFGGTYKMFYHKMLSTSRLVAMPGINSGRGLCCGWYKPVGGYVGVSENAISSGTVARRADVRIPGMAAVCGDGPLARDASGARTFGLRVEATDLTMEGGIYVGFVATPPDSIDFHDAERLWDTAVMWRIVNNTFVNNVPLGKSNNRDLQGSKFTQLFYGPSRYERWSTDQLTLGDELRVTASVTARVPPCSCDNSYLDEDRDVNQMALSASLNGKAVVLPVEMAYCSFAMELWPYVAVCGRVTAVCLLV